MTEKRSIYITDNKDLERLKSFGFFNPGEPGEGKDGSDNYHFTLDNLDAYHEYMPNTCNAILGETQVEDDTYIETLWDLIPEYLQRQTTLPFADTVDRQGSVDRQDAVDRQGSVDRQDTLPFFYKAGLKSKKRKSKKRKSKKRKSKKRNLRRENILKIRKQKKSKKKKYGGSGDEPHFLSFPNQYQTPIGKMETCHVTIDDIGSHSRDATWYPQDYLLDIITGGRYHDQPDIDEIIDNNRVNCVINKVVAIFGLSGPRKPDRTKWDPDIDLMPGSKYMYAIPVCEEHLWPKLYYSKSEDKMKCYASNELDVLYHTHPVRFVIDPLEPDITKRYEHGNKIKYRPFHHNCLVNDKPVVMAGEIEVSEDSEGNIKYTISNGSGHYKPQWNPASQQLIRDYYFKGKTVDTTTPDVMVDTSKIDIQMRSQRRPRS